MVSPDLISADIALRLRASARGIFNQKTETAFQIGLRRTTTILAELKRLGHFDLFAFVLTVPLDERISIPVRDAAVSAHPALFEDFLPRNRIAGFALDERLGRAVRSALVNLRHQRVDAVYFLLKDVVDGNCDRRLERVRLRETIGVVHEDGVLFQRLRVRHEERHRHHEGRVLDEDSRVAMVRVVIVRAVREHQIGFPVADQPGNRASIFERRFQLAIVNVEHLDRRAPALGTLFDLGRSTQGERSAGHVPVADVAIRDRDQLHMMPGLRPHRCRAAALELGIIRVSSEGDDAEFAVVLFVFGAERGCGQNGECESQH